MCVVNLALYHVDCGFFFIIVCWANISCGIIKTELLSHDWEHVMGHLKLLDVVVCVYGSECDAKVVPSNDDTMSKISLYHSLVLMSSLLVTSYLYVTYSMS